MNLTEKIQSLTTQANNITGKSDTTLSSAVESLIDGYGSNNSIVTRQVVFDYNDASAMYYTNATMTPQSITNGDKDINAELPVGSLVVYIRTGTAEPTPFPPTQYGVQQIAQYAMGTRGSIIIYEVLPDE